MRRMTRQVTNLAGIFLREMSGDARFLCKAVASRVLTKVIIQGNNIIPPSGRFKKMCQVYLSAMRITGNS